MPLGIPHSVFLGWDSDDQDKALAYTRNIKEICKQCGTRDSEWDKDQFAYVAYTYRCRGCETTEMERDNIPQDAKGVYVGLEKPRPGRS